MDIDRADIDGSYDFNINPQDFCTSTVPSKGTALTEENLTQILSGIFVSDGTEAIQQYEQRECEPELTPSEQLELWLMHKLLNLPRP